MADNLNMSGVISAIQASTQAIGALNQSLNKLLPAGAYQPFSQSDTGSANNSLYYSTTTSKLTYRDPSGTLHQLY